MEAMAGEAKVVVVTEHVDAKVDWAEEVATVADCQALGVAMPAVEPMEGVQAAEEAAAVGGMVVVAVQAAVGSMVEVELAATWALGMAGREQEPVHVAVWKVEGESVKEVMAAVNEVAVAMVEGALEVEEKEVEAREAVGREGAEAGVEPAEAAMAGEGVRQASPMDRVEARLA